MKLKNLIKFVTYNLTDHLVFPSTIIDGKRLLIVRLDAIGDYILFQNFLVEIRNNIKYQNFQITIVANEAWRPLEEARTCQIADEYIWVNRKYFFRNPLYRWRILRKISQKAYLEAFQPNYSREYFVGDRIISIINAKYKIGCDGDLSNLTQKEKTQTDKYYNRLIKITNDVKYEFLRNHEICEKFLNASIKRKDLPSLETIETPVLKLKNPYIVFFVGAATDNRKWSSQNYALLLDRLSKMEKYRHHNFIISGDKSDTEEIFHFTKSSSSTFVDLIGKTTLTELVSLISNADLLITNDTSAHHIGVSTACGTTIVLYAGNHFGRFIPLSNHNSNYLAVRHPLIDLAPLEYKSQSNTPGYISQLDINEITVEKVYDAITNI